MSNWSPSISVRAQFTQIKSDIAVCSYPSYRVLFSEKHTKQKVQNHQHFKYFYVTTTKGKNTVYGKDNNQTRVLSELAAVSIKLVFFR